LGAITRQGRRNGSHPLSFPLFSGAGTTQHNLSCTTTTRQTEKKNCHSPLGRIFPEKRLNKNIKEKKFIFFKKK
jgi:hypothetical protein